MNIFYLHENPSKAPQYLYDKHCVKMLLETAQLLCTAHQHYAEKYEYDNSYIPYKKAYYNHPSNVWARESHENYMWLWNYFVAISKLYTSRYGKTHLSTKKLTEAGLHKSPKFIPLKGFTQPPQCMPDEFKSECSLDAYWNYYINGKEHIARRDEFLWVFRPREVEEILIRNAKFKERYVQ